VEILKAPDVGTQALDFDLSIFSKLEPDLDVCPLFDPFVISSLYHHSGL